MKKGCFCGGLKADEEGVRPSASQTERAARAKILWQKKHSEDQRLKTGPCGWGSQHRGWGGAGKEGESRLSRPHTVRKGLFSSREQQEVFESFYAGRNGRNNMITFAS